MSASLHWEPANKNLPSLPKTLLCALRKRHDQDSIDEVYDEKDIPYLSGLRDAEVQGAKELIAHINTHEKVRIFTVW